MISYSLVSQGEKANSDQRSLYKGLKAVLDNTIYLLYASGSYFSHKKIIIMIAFILCFHFAA